MDLVAQIAHNVTAVRERIAEAARRSGRGPDEVQLVAVTKYVGPAEVEALLAAGCRDFGESRPQALWDKVAALPARPARWHFIGHLQRNKVKRTLPHVTLLHAGDSQRLLEAVAETAQAEGRTAEVLLEVNISGEEAKHGLAPDEVAPLLPALARLAGVRIRGLMTMSRLGGTEDEAREDFARLRELRERLLTACPPEISLQELSMGMSGDFEAAIAEGATLVRIGSALFEGLT